MDKIIKVYLPKWAAILYAILAIVLIPWIFDLASSLPRKHVTTHWDALWVGFDIIMLIAIIITVYLTIKKTIWVIVSATALATLFIIDAWFDILTARPGHEQRISILFGVVEIFLAALTYRMVYHVLHHSTPQKTFMVTNKKNNQE